MTQHIKTHFKERGINSLVANGFNLPPAPSVKDKDGEGSEGEHHNDGESVEDDDEEIEPC